MLGGFHTTKCLEYCVEKYIEKTGIDNCLSQTKVVAVTAMKSLLEKINYARFLKTRLIFAHAIQSLKWEAFIENTYVQNM